MCGRVTLTETDGRVVADWLEAEIDEEDLAAWRPRYNGAPTDELWQVVAHGSGKKLSRARWGVSRGIAPGKSKLVINTRAEAIESRAWKSALESRRSLVVTDGFYEWTGAGKDRHPLRFVRATGGLVLMAGIFDEDASGQRAFSIVTCAPNSLLAPLHDRMPVVLDGEATDAWLAAPRVELLAPVRADYLVANKVSRRVNAVANDDPACLDPESEDAPAPEPTTARQLRLF